MRSRDPRNSWRIVWTISRGGFNVVSFSQATDRLDLPLRQRKKCRRAGTTPIPAQAGPLPILLHPKKRTTTAHVDVGNFSPWTKRNFLDLAITVLFYPKESRIAKLAFQPLLLAAHQFPFVWGQRELVVSQQE